MRSVEHLFNHVLKSEGKTSTFGATERLDCKKFCAYNLCYETPDANAQDVVPTQNTGERVETIMCM